ncbi:MAG: nucleotide disphospho-sugar-binding domain-containing protein [Ilumatobacteraceae bacterium]
MKLLVVSPDYASHYLPMSAIARAARRRRVAVTVATGRALRTRVEHDGFRWRELRMSRGNNPGVLDDRTRRDAAADDDLSGFFAATHRGMVPTLTYQAEARAADLLWEPEQVATATVEVADDEQPEAVLVDHLAFACTLGLRAAGRRFTTFVPGHPTQLPIGGEVYGAPSAWPSAFTPPPADIEALRACCRRVAASFTDQYNSVLASLAPTLAAVEDAFAAHGDDVLYNSPAPLQRPERAADLPPRHAFLGSCVRRERPTDDVRRWLDSIGDRPFVYVSFGTFLSARVDVVRRVLEALADLDRVAAVSTGTAAISDLGPLPDGWLVAPALPQVVLVDRADAVVTHGGNGTVTESLTAGRPMLVLPLSTDQFETAGDLERTGLGLALDPNTATRPDLAQAITATLAEQIRRRAEALAEKLRAHPGPELAADRLLDGA